MNTELTRRYTQPVTVSAATALHYRQYKNSTSVASSLGSIPDSQELLAMKTDLEGILPNSEKRLKYLQRDMFYIKKHVKIRDSGQDARKSSGKTNNPIKREDESSDLLQSTPSKPQNDRQLALEALRRKRRRDDHDDKIKRHDTQPKKKKGEDTNRHGNKQQNSNNQHHHKNDTDFVRVKAKDQIPVQTFWSVIEPYFRALEEQDREFLLEKTDADKYYSIPPLGRYYSDVWSEDEPIPAMSRSHSPATSVSSSRQGSHDHLRYSDDEFSYGSLTERLLSSLMQDESKVTIAHDDDDDDDFSIPFTEGSDKVEKASDFLIEDVIQFEERLKRELRYAGLFGENDVDLNTREDDEICAELRIAARELKEQHKINEQRKKQLLDVVDQQLQYDQYRQVLDSLDVQVEQCYLKRFRVQKSKKKKASSSKSALSEHAVHAMTKRKAWIDALEGIFKDKNVIQPTESIYYDYHHHQHATKQEI
ncbi:hypothetical protein K501DRAFT_244821 [Backusella circina FSU 941]|nr:hypothetical protein K501DRAFT_244821 [Backusella circina FSU 941]